MVPGVWQLGDVLRVDDPRETRATDRSGRLHAVFQISNAFGALDGIFAGNIRIVQQDGGGYGSEADSVQSCFDGGSIKCLQTHQRDFDKIEPEIRHALDEIERIVGPL